MTSPSTRAKALLDAATPGPWQCYEGAVCVGRQRFPHISIANPKTQDHSDLNVARCSESCDPNYKANAALIAATPELLSQLVAEVERLERERDGLQRALNDIAGQDFEETPRELEGYSEELLADALRHCGKTARAALEKGPADGRDE